MCSNYSIMLRVEILYVSSSMLMEMELERNVQYVDLLENDFGLLTLLKRQVNPNCFV